ncbi:YitT family protein [Merdibacter massiliensis]|uniref:YitT family protein n=1 Tax=Merdibacter massiliensis TaxID=1871030 RepID=UPI00096A6C0F|nr:YitT family protein [Merdibacter massiliensis]
MKKLDSWKQYLYVILGSALFAASVNLLIVPVSLYSAGIVGIAQILRTLLSPFLPFASQFDIAGIINLLLNIPLFLLAFRSISRSFFFKTILSIIIQTLVMSLVMIPKTPILDDVLASCLIGGILSGFGVGITLRASGSCGGTDIIGFYLSNKNFPITVGQLSIIINIGVFGICALLFNVQTAIYSIIYMVVMYSVCDHIHYQNINMTAMIFTKNIDVQYAIMYETGRGVTYWKGAGAYTDDETLILVCAINKYEENQLKKIIYTLDEHAFVIFSEGMSISGNFEKRL